MKNSFLQGHVACIPACSSQGAVPHDEVRPSRVATAKLMCSTGCPLASAPTRASTCFLDGLLQTATTVPFTRSPNGSAQTVDRSRSCRVPNLGDDLGGRGER